MITIGILAIIGASVGFYFSKTSWYSHSWDEYLLKMVIGMLFSLIISTPIAFLIRREVKTNVETFEIECLSDNMSTSGSFFLATGQISGNMKYMFYVKQGGSFKMISVSYENAVIRYTDSTPKVDKFTDYTNNLFAIQNDNLRFVIHIPKGSIKHNYTLDLE